MRARLHRVRHLDEELARETADPAADARGDRGGRAAPGRDRVRGPGARAGVGRPGPAGVDLAARRRAGRAGGVRRARTSGPTAPTPTRRGAGSRPPGCRRAGTSTGWRASASAWWTPRWPRRSSCRWRPPCATTRAPRRPAARRWRWSTYARTLEAEADGGGGPRAGGDRRHPPGARRSWATRRRVEARIAELEQALPGRRRAARIGAAVGRDAAAAGRDRRPPVGVIRAIRAGRLAPADALALDEAVARSGEAPALLLWQHRARGDRRPLPAGRLGGRRRGLRVPRRRCLAAVHRRRHGLPRRGHAVRGAGGAGRASARRAADPRPVRAAARRHRRRTARRRGGGGARRAHGPRRRPQGHRDRRAPRPRPGRWCTARCWSAPTWTRCGRAVRGRRATAIWTVCRGRRPAGPTTWRTPASRTSPTGCATRWARSRVR